MKLLKIAAILQGILVGLWVMYVITTPDNLMTLVYLVYLLPVCGISCVLALWNFVRRPESRRLAGIVLATPVVGYSLAAWAKALFGLPVFPPSGLLIAVGACCVGGIVFLPHKVARLLPEGLVSSRFFNGGLLVFMLLIVVAWFVPLIGLGLADRPAVRSSDNNEWIIVAWIGHWFVSLSALPALVYGYLCLFRAAAGRRKVHVAQIVAAGLVLVILVPATWLASVVTTPLG